jgi:hypothetical protein
VGQEEKHVVNGELQVPGLSKAGSSLNLKICASKLKLGELEHPAPIPPPPLPKIIPYNPTYVAAGPNLVKNGSFEEGNFGPGTEMAKPPPASCRWG